ncbi:MAG TPA: tetratricopeptide repeat protein, partial [Rhizomicrobium sp.]|nr:tetratricopeptide repeat protein [Rhizomicrobium sp.]
MRGERPLRKPHLQRLASELRGSETERAQSALHDWLARHPDDADANWLAARASIRQDRRHDAASLLARCLDIAPDFTAARFEHAKLLLRLHRYGAALAEAGRLLAAERDNPLFLQLKAAILEGIGEEEQALPIRQHLADENPGRADCWTRLGDTLRATGDQAR